jgi:hypothetical protein
VVRERLILEIELKGLAEVAKGVLHAVWTTVDAYGHRLEIHGWSGGQGFEFLRVCRSSCPHWESVALGPNPKRPIVRAVGYCVPTSIRPKRWFRRLSAR